MIARAAFRRSTGFRRRAERTPACRGKKALFYSSSTRALILYCLRFGENIDHTVFCFEETVPEPIRRTFCHLTLPTPPYRNRLAFCLFMLRTRLKILRLVARLRSLNGQVSIFGSDNQVYSPFFYRAGSFTALEEGAGN